jgi:hypothetical protein
VVPASGQGSSGHIRNAILIPLGELAERDGELARPPDRRRSRAARATVILKQPALPTSPPLQAGEDGTLSCSRQLGPALADFPGARDQPVLR